MADFSVKTQILKSESSNIEQVKKELKTLSERCDSLANNLGMNSSAIARIKKAIKNVSRQLDNESVSASSIARSLMQIADAYERTERYIINAENVTALDIKKLKQLLKETMDKIKELAKKIFFGNDEKLNICDGDPVNMCNGNYIDSVLEFSFKNGPKLSFKREYNSVGNMIGALGIGWSHNYETHIEISGEDIMLISQDGVEFFESEDGRTYKSGFGGNERHIIKTEEGYFYRDVEKETDYHFSEEGMLLSMGNLDYDRITFDYAEGKLYRATDLYGNYIEYSYQENELLSKVESSKGDILKLEYNGITLISVSDDTSAVDRYEYDENDYLCAYILPDGDADFRIEYDAEGRVLKQTFIDGSVTTFEHDEDKSVFTNELGDKFTYYHDAKGRHTGTDYPDGSSEKYEYDTNNNVTFIRARNGMEHAYEYDGKGRLVKETTGKAAVTEYEYEGDERKPVKTLYPDGGIQTAKYDVTGRLTSETTVSGLIINYEYDKMGRPCKKTYSNGLSYELLYDERGNIVAENRNDGRKTGFEYNSKDELIAVIRPDGTSEKYEYDSNGALMALTNALGLRKEYSYDQYGKLLSVTDFDGYKLSYTYDEKGRLSSECDKALNITRYEYDACSNRTKIIYPNGASALSEYDSMGQVVKQILPDGETREFSYDSCGMLSKIKEGNAITNYTYSDDKRTVEILDCFGNKRIMEHDFRGHIKKDTLPNGKAYEYEYDTTGKCILVTDETGKRLEFEYDINENLISRTFENGAKESYEYGMASELSKITDANGNSTAYYYNLSGNVEKKVYQDGTEVIYEYDAIGQNTSVFDRLGHRLSYEYDAAGNKISITDSVGSKTCYAYTPLGFIESVKNALGNETRYSYDEIGNLTGIDADNGHISTFERSKGGKILAKKDAKGNSFSYIYDAFGNVTEVTDAKGNTTKYSYDLFGRLSGKVLADGSEIKYFYDENGRMNKVKNAGSEMTFEYNAEGRIIRSCDYNGNELSYEYENGNILKSLIYPDGSKVSYEYDDRMRKSKVTYKDISVSYTYDENGKVKKKVYGNGMSEAYTYDKKGKLAENILYKNDDVVRKTTLKYDLNGNIIEKTVEEASLETINTTYEYDRLNQLVRVCENAEEVAYFEYDRWGNRILSKNLGNESTYSYNELNQIISQTENGTVTKYSYDENGNLISILKGETKDSLEYSLDNKLKSVTTLDKSISYSYDAFGNRISEICIDNGKEKKNDYTIDYSLPLNRILSISDGEVTKNYLWNGDLEAKASGMSEDLDDNNDAEYLINDHLGSFIMSFDDAGNKKGKRYYDAFGKVVSDESDIPFGFTGYLLNGYGDTYYAGARGYDAGLGRFINKDDEQFIHYGLDQSINLYQYCLNNPLVFIDPNGNDCYIFTSYADSMSEAYLTHYLDYLTEYYNCPLQEIHIIKCDTKDDFVNGWNNMGTDQNGNPVDIDTVILDAHGGFTGFELGNGSTFRNEDFNNLEDKTMGQMVMSVCDAGDLRNPNGMTIGNYEVGPNPAAEFAKKVNGAPVMAADGDITLGSNRWYNWFKIYPNKKYKQTIEDKKKKGWVVYQEKDGKITTDVLKEKSLNLKDMLKYTKKRQTKCYRESKKKH